MTNAGLLRSGVPMDERGRLDATITRTAQVWFKSWPDPLLVGAVLQGSAQHGGAIRLLLLTKIGPCIVEQG